MVTGNKRDFPEDQLGATHVVNAGELLNLIALDSSGADRDKLLTLTQNKAREHTVGIKTRQPRA